MDEKTSRTFAWLLKRYRAATGLTQEALAERAGLSARGVADLESGRRSRPRRDTVQRLAVALGLTGRQRAIFYAAAGVHDPARPASLGLVGLTPGAESPPILVGRHDEVTLVERHLAGDGPPALLFAGEPGIGKTRMLHETARARHCVQRRGVRPRAHVALAAAVTNIWARRVPKRDACGIHGALFYGLSDKQAYYPTRRDAAAINPDDSRFRAA